MLPLTLIPLNAADHTALLQAVYDAAPGYWAMYDLPGANPDQAAHDLAEAAETPGRTLLGILLPVDEPSGAGAEMIGMIDVRLHYPAEQVASLGLIVVAQPYQRLGVGTAAWALLEPWLAQGAGMARARLRVEQFNHPAQRFFGAVGFAMTGESARAQVGDKFVRFLSMEKELPATA